MSGILALDLASNAGYCVGEPGTMPVYGSFRIARPSCSIGVFALDFHNQIRGHIALHRPATIIFEAPILKVKTRAKSGTSIDVARKLMGLAWHVEFLAAHYQIPIFEASPSDVAEYFIGRNNWAGGRPEKKRRTIEACKALGFAPKDDDAADALALWHFAWWRLQPKNPPKRWDGPLLGRSA